MTDLNIVVAAVLVSSLVGFTALAGLIRALHRRLVRILVARDIAHAKREELATRTRWLRYHTGLRKRGVTGSARREDPEWMALRAAWIDADQVRKDLESKRGR